MTPAWEKEALEIDRNNPKRYQPLQIEYGAIVGAGFTSAWSSIKTLPQLSILYVWDADYPWDVRTEKICATLTSAGHEVHIVARNRSRLPTTEKLPEGIVHRMRPWGWAGRLDGALGFPAFFNPRWRSLIAEVAAQVKADLIIVRDLPLCPTAISVGGLLDVPVMLDMAEHYPAITQANWDAGRQKPFDWIVRNPSLVRLVEKYCIRRVQHILVVAEEMATRLVSMGVARSHLTIVGNTTPAASVAARRLDRDSAEPILLVYLGLLEIARGIEEMISAVALLRGSKPTFRLLLIGTGRDERLFREHAKALQLTASDVDFAGYVPHARAMELVASADIGLLPLHRNEHMDTTVPNKLFDYMSVGLPVITSDTIPSARIVQAESAGVVFQARDASKLAASIRLLADADVRAAMGERGRAAVVRQYNWERDSEELLSAVEVASRSRAAPAPRSM